MLHCSLNYGRCKVPWPMFGCCVVAWPADGRRLPGPFTYDSSTRAKQASRREGRDWCRYSFLYRFLRYLRILLCRIFNSQNLEASILDQSIMWVILRSLGFHQLDGRGNSNLTKAFRYDFETGSHIVSRRLGSIANPISRPSFSTPRVYVSKFLSSEFDPS